MRCPYCTEEIADEAIACSHCTRDLRFFQPLVQQVHEFRKDIETQLAALEAQVATLSETLSHVAEGTSVASGKSTPGPHEAVSLPRPGHAKSFWPAYAAIALTFLIIYLVANEQVFLGYETHVLFSCLAFYLLAGLWYAFIDRGKHFGRYVKTAMVIGISVAIGIPLAAIALSDVTVNDILQDWEPIPAIVLAVGFAYITGCLIGDFLEARLRHTPSAPYALRVAQRAFAGSQAAHDNPEARDRSIKRLAKVIEALGPLIGIAGTILTAVVTALLKKASNG